MDSLPSELELEITKWLYVSDEGPFTLKRHYKHRSRLIPLSRTCQRWRAPALQTLFRTIVVLDIDTEKLESFVHHFALQLTASCRNISLSLCPWSLANPSSDWSDYAQTWDVPSSMLGNESARQAVHSDPPGVLSDFQARKMIWRYNRHKTVHWIMHNVLVHVQRLRITSEYHETQHIPCNTWVDRIGKHLNLEHFEFIYRPEVLKSPSYTFPSDFQLSTLYFDAPLQGSIPLTPFLEENKTITTLVINISHFDTKKVRYIPTLPIKLKNLHLLGSASISYINNLLDGISHHLTELDISRLDLIDDRQGDLKPFHSHTLQLNARQLFKMLSGLTGLGYSIRFLVIRQVWSATLRVATPSTSKTCFRAVFPNITMVTIICEPNGELHEIRKDIGPWITEVVEAERSGTVFLKRDTHPAYEYLGKWFLSNTPWSID